MKRASTEFDDLTFSHNPATEVRAPRPDEIEPVWRAASAAVGLPLAEPKAIARVLAHDPASIWIFEQAKRVTGGFALLHLSALGVERLVAAELDPYNPAIDCLALSSENPAGCYFWLTFKLQPYADGISQVFEKLCGPRFKNSDLWANPYTDDGRRFVTNVGFVRVQDAASPTLYRYVRKANRAEARKG
jgi:hypothetical protein